jgi:pimeloyl-ACP methyl ester carboxylesterase
MIPYIDFGGAGLPLHFLHANGYPPACYRPLIDLLTTRYHVFGMLLRPLWPEAKPEELDDWRPLSEDLLRFLDKGAPGGVIGVGHSIGALVTLRTALRHPGRFRALVLIDPVLFPPYFIVAWNVMRALGLGYRLHPLIRGALRRRRTFDDLEAVFAGYRRREVFRYMDDEALRTYISGITRAVDGSGHELVYSPEWEARIYYTGIWRDMDLWRDLPNLEPPVLIIRGGETDTFLARTAARVRRLRPQTKVVTIEKATHLVPLERPQETFDTMDSFLKEVL